MYYPCSENKDADQLRSYCICRLLVFPRGGSYGSSFVAFETLLLQKVFIGTCMLVISNAAQIFKIRFWANNVNHKKTIYRALFI